MALLNPGLKGIFIRQDLEHGINARDNAYTESEKDFRHRFRPQLSGSFSFSKQDDIEVNLREERLVLILRLNFNTQFERLKGALEECELVSQWPTTLRNSSQAWSTAITTMRKLSGLESPPELANALCFLVEQDLAKWAEILPGIKEICSLMWQINWDAIPRLQSHFSTKLEQLRESVAKLLVRANTVLGLKPHGADQEHSDKLGVSNQQRRTNIERGSLATESPDPPPITARQKKPPDRNPHEDKPLLLTAVVTLVTSVIFALVVYFILTLYILTPTVVMLPNPWQTTPSQDATNSQATLLETYPASHSRVATQPCPSTNPMMLDEEFPETINPQHLEPSPRAHSDIPWQSPSIGIRTSYIATRSLQFLS